jgi:hypothetical protein
MAAAATALSLAKFLSLTCLPSLSPAIGAAAWQCALHHELACLFCKCLTVRSPAVSFSYLVHAHIKYVINCNFAYVFAVFCDARRCPELASLFGLV